LLLALAAAGVGIMCAVLAEAPPVDGDAGVLAGVALVVAAGSPLIWRLRVDRLDGPGIYGLLTVLFFGVTSLVWLGLPNDPGPGLTQSDIAAALVLVALGLAIFGVGARVSAGRAIRTRLLAFPRGRAPTLAALTVSFVLGLLGSILGIATGRYGYISGAEAPTGGAGLLISLLAASGALVVLATALTYFGARERPLLVPLVVFAAIQTAIGFFIGFKGAALQPLVFVALAYLRASGKVPWGRIAVLAAVTFLVVVPANQVYRLSLRNDALAPSEALKQVFSGGSGGSGEESAYSNPYSYISTRFRLIDHVALIASNTPSQYPYAGGAKYSALPAIIVVPRALWPGKPVLADAGEFSHTYWGLAEDVATSTPLTQPGDLYRNFGLGGVAIGMFLWGLAIGAWQRAYHRWRSPRIEMIYIYSLVSFITYVESDLPNLLATAAKGLPFAFVVAWLLLPGRDGEPGYRRLAGAATRAG
jgi:hypothetical protein